MGEVARRLERAGEVRRILDARVLQLEGETRAARRTANGVAFVGALVAIAALVGWAVALGWWEISWMDPPAPEPPAGERGQGSAAGAGSRPL